MDERDDLEGLDPYSLEEREERERAERVADIERRRAERLAMPRPPDWTQYRDLNSMDSRTFGLWIDAGRPKLGPPPPPPASEPERKDYDVLKVLGELAADTHVEMARVEKKFAAEMAVLRGALTVAINENAIAQVGRLTELKEIREAAQVRQAQEIVVLERQVNALRRELLDLQREAHPRLAGKALAARSNGSASYDD